MKVNPDTWLSVNNERAVLLMSECNECGKKNFPPLQFCPNCHSENLIKKEIDRTGVLYSFSQIHVNHKIYPAPYIVGYVDFPEGLRVFGQIKANIDDVHLGMEVETMKDVFDSENDELVEQYCFVPSNRSEING